MAGTIGTALLFIGPSYVANAAPLVFGGGRPLDANREFRDGRLIFGPHKTVRGFLAGIIAGSLVGLGESLVDPRLLLAGFAISIGAVLGDLLGAFVKRRLDMKPGHLFPVVDQLDFVLGALVFSYPVFSMGLVSVLIVVIVTPPIHLGTNLGAYLLGLKKNYW
jgi:CDP-2,3-bis-(O-geranylgeranyl)-sn-glycerol synthase